MIRWFLIGVFLQNSNENIFHITPVCKQLQRACLQVLASLDNAQLSPQEVSQRSTVDQKFRCVESVALT